MSPQRAARLGVNPNEVKITTRAGMYAGKWILWIPNKRYPEVDERYRQILTESHNLYELCFWVALLKREISRGS